MLAACEFTICATQRTTISRIVGDLERQMKIKNESSLCDTHKTTIFYGLKEIWKGGCGVWGGGKKRKPEFTICAINRATIL